MNPRLEIFSQGEEIISGQITDTNAAWLSQQAIALGFEVTRHTAVGDRLAALVVLLREIADRAECCLCTGGLGPTSDDLTAEAVAAAFGLPLVLDEMAYHQIQQYFTRRNRAMPASNIKQAMLPTGAVRLDNDCGTAPGFALKYRRCWFAFMPGVPSEMQQMYLQKVLPHLQSQFVLQPSYLVTLKTIGLGESAIQDVLQTVTLPDNVQLGFRAAQDVQVKLLFPFAYPEPLAKQCIANIAEKLGDYVYAIDGFGVDTGDLVAVIDKQMQQLGYGLVVLETVSQGWLAAQCIGRQWLQGACYEKSLQAFLQRASLLISEDNPVLAEHVARTLQRQYASHVALVQWSEPLGEALIVHTTLLVGEKLQQVSHTIAGTLQRKQQYAALMSLDVLRRYLVS